MGDGTADPIGEFVDAVRVMRRHQREYFACRSREALAASKVAEARVDVMLTTLGGSRRPVLQGRLF